MHGSGSHSAPCWRSLGLFVLSGAIAGAELFVTMLVFIFACIYALRGEDPDSVAHNQRTAGAGWFGKWF